jgi:hypothetical protein
LGDASLDTTRVPPTPEVLKGLLDETLALLAAARTSYHERGEVVLIAPAATAIRMLCHAPRGQTALLEQLENHGVVVPKFRDASPGTLMGYAVAFHMRWPETVSAQITSSLNESTTGVLSWRGWWESNAVCLPVDPTTGWQSGRLSITRKSLVTQWANRYGGAHVDTKGPERWLVDLVNLEHLGYWAKTPDGVVLSWFDEPRSSDASWQALTVPSRAVAHLVLVRLAAEIGSAYGQPTPDTLTALYPTYDELVARAKSPHE